jgi:phage-related protein
MVEFLGALHKPLMMRTSRDIGEIVKKVALVAQSLVNIWRYAGLLLATLLNMMMSFPLKLVQTYISYCKMAVDGAREC